LDGKPVPGATVTFRPESGEGTPSYGGTDSQGRYSLMFTRNKHGAMVGKHVVSIETKRMSESELAELRAEGQEVPTTPYVEIPQKYQAQGALTAEVEGRDNEINFDLKSS
jgi:hypothetical protein